MSILVSGGFDPLHRGHVQLLYAAAKHGLVIVALNSDAWLIRKKGYAFMRFDERKSILSALFPVYRVVPVDDADGTVCSALRTLQPDCFANGGDREYANAAEGDACRELGIRQLFGVGGGKVQSSSNLIERIRK